MHKAFDQVYRNGTIYLLYGMGVRGKMMHMLDQWISKNYAVQRWRGACTRLQPLCLAACTRLQPLCLAACTKLPILNGSVLTVQGPAVFDHGRFGGEQNRFGDNGSVMEKINQQIQRSTSHPVQL